MNFNPKNEFDFLKNQAFVLWVNHQNQEETELWHRWLHENTSKAEYFHKAKAIINSFQFSGEEKIDDSRLDSIREKLLGISVKHNQNENHIGTKKLNSNWHLSKWAMAASIALIFTMGTLIYSYITDLHSNSWTEVITEKGERKHIILPDGSSVMLDSHSSMEYISDFESDRRVKLTGRAFFEVKKLNGKQFEVFSDMFGVKVLGTSFDMNTDEKRGSGHVALVTGKVKVKIENAEEIGLLPNEAAYIDLGENKITKGAFDTDQILGWRQNILKFKDESYKVVFERISNWYGVEFIYHESLDLNGLYSATYRDQKLDDILKGLAYASELQFEIKADKVFVSKQ
ncbi:FecR family protein [Algoriphagus resistens]|uniref:FecR family protein n=1 Tax=Algoriphagus resistens TaxID=1750590 RepID=UPI000716A793|nr:FecR family protein [Algoriphagus resistens]